MRQSAAPRLLSPCSSARSASSAWNAVEVAPGRIAGSPFAVCVIRPGTVARRPFALPAGMAFCALLGISGPAAADDLGPLASECVGSGCPALSAYPSPFNFGPVPPAWRGHDEAFNGIVLGAFIIPVGGGAESEGRLAVGGSFLPARGFSVGISGGGTFVVGPSSGFDNLIVRNLATGTNAPYVGTVATLGTTVTGLVRVGGASSGITYDMGVLSDNVGMTPADLGIDFDALFATLQAKSACWAGLSATGTLVDEVNLGNGWVLVGDGSANPQVFNLGPTDLDVANQELNFRDIPVGATVLINVGGAAPVVGMARINADVTGAPTLFNVLFNLHQATAAAIPTEVNGSVLIPAGDLTLGGSINGRLLVGGDVTFSGAGQELHNYPFTGELPSCAETPTATATETATETATATATATASETGTATEAPTATATGTASSTPTNTATRTATPPATPTPSRQPDGQACSDPLQCLSGFCVDGVCCESACDGPNQSCNQPGRAGQCVAIPTAAPSASRPGLAVALLVLLAIAARWLRRGRFT